MFVVLLPVIGLVDEVQQDLHHGVEELAGQVLRLRSTEILKMEV